MALLEASRGKWGSAWDKVLLFCFHYDPIKRGYVASALRVMQAGGLLTIAALGAFFTLMWRRRGAREHLV
jgi:protein SCO1/2